MPLSSPLRRMWRQRVLVAALARRELVARYRGGVLGFFWSLLNPLLLLLVYATVFRLVFVPRADVRPYALFLFGGVLVWGYVSSALLDAAETFRANGPLLRKTTVSPEVFPAVAVTAYASQADRAEALAVGFQQHLPKPVDPGHVVQVIHELTRGPG